MKLYYSPGACSLATHIVAEEAGLKTDLVKVDLATHKTSDGVDFYTINPRGYVPALVLDDGTLVTEVAALLEYLADQNPASGLVPQAGTIERVKVRSWVAFISSELHKTFSLLFNSKTPEVMRETLLGRLHVRFKELESVLNKQSYLMGETFGIADAYAFTILSWGKFLKLDLSAYPNLAAYAARVAARPAVQKALKAEGLA